MRARVYDSTWRKVQRQELSDKQDGKCAYCYDDVPKDRQTFDHVKARSMGGVDNIDNGVMACEDCNYIKGAYSKNQFLKLIKNPTSFRTRMIWMRRRINLATMRAVRNIMRSVGR